MTNLSKLAARIEAAERSDNCLDVLAEIALFEPGGCFTTCRANSAGTKVIYTDHAGHVVTCWASDLTRTPEIRASVAAALRAKEVSDHG